MKQSSVELPPLATATAIPYDTDELLQVKSYLEEQFGTPAHDECASYPQLDEFLDMMKDMDFYGFECLMRADPRQQIVRRRAKLKAILLPVVQIVVPLLLIKHEIDNYDWDNGGICPHNGSPTFRVVGFIMFIYSVWQIEDELEAGPTRKLTQILARHYAMTGKKFDVWFGKGFWAQWLCGLAVVVLEYFLFSSSDSPLDLVMNCVALVFLLQIDNEWVDERQRDKGLQAAAYLFKELRDIVHKDEAMIQKQSRRVQLLRRTAEARVTKSMDAAIALFLGLGYCLALLFLVCPSAGLPGLRASN